MRPAASRGVPDPVSRASEILFGLIMVLPFTLSLAGTEAGRADVRAVLSWTIRAGAWVEQTLTLKAGW